jgi:iron complex outermembrane recepter protein
MGERGGCRFPLFGSQSGGDEDQIELNQIVELNEILVMRKFVLVVVVCVLAVLSISGQTNASKILVKGLVQSETGENLVGVHISLKGDSKAYDVLTDAQGEFSVENVLSGNYILKASCLGCVENTQKIVVIGGMESLKISMKRNENQLSEVTVTTQKRSQNLIEVPITISAISSSMLKNFQINDLDVLSQYVPGLEVQIQSPNNPSFAIRGVTSDDGDSRVQQRVSVFQDGVSISKARGSVVELFDMERVEVAKGPQGTLFGRSAENGAIHLIQNKPVNFLTGEFSLGYGNYKEKIANGMINTPLVNGKLLNRFSFAYNERDGFIKNLSGGTLNGKNTIALRNILRYLPDSKTTLDVILNYQHDSPPGTSFKSGTYAPAGGDVNPNSFADLGGGGKDSLYIHRDVAGISVPLTRTLSDVWTLNSLTAFRHFNTDEAFNADGTRVRVLYFHEKENNNQFSQEFRFNFTDKKKLSGFLGASFFYENTRQEIPFETNPQLFYTLMTPVIASAYATEMSSLSQAINMLGSAGYLTSTQTAYFLSQVPSAKPLIIDGKPNPTTNLPALKPLLPYLSSYLSSSSLALLSLFDGSALPTSYSETYANYNKTAASEIFADATYKLTHRLSLTMGLRGTYEHQVGEYSSWSSGPSVLGYLTGYYPNVLSYTTNGEKKSASKDYLSYVGRLAVNYIFDSNSVYASVSRGRRPGVVDIGTNGADSTNFLKPEIIWSYEAGVKGALLSNSLSYDLAVYYYDWSHFQSNELNTSTLKFVAADAGKAHSFGIETGLQYRFAQGSSLFANYGFIDGKFNDKGENGQTQEYAGNTFRLTPKHSFSVGANVIFPVKKQVIAYFRPSYSYKSKVYFEDENTDQLSQKGYGLANLNAGVTFASGKWFYDLGVYSKNLFDKEYTIDGGNTGSLFGIPTFVGGTRRTYGVVLKMRF